LSKTTRNEGKLYKNLFNENIDNVDGKVKELNSPNCNISEKKEFLKKILISAMKMKIKLKEQLDALNHNEIFPESLILSSLNFLK